jgi:hypothetical protein
VAATTAMLLRRLRPPEEAGVGEPPEGGGDCGGCGNCGAAYGLGGIGKVACVDGPTEGPVDGEDDGVCGVSVMTAILRSDPEICLRGTW